MKRSLLLVLLLTAAVYAQEDQTKISKDLSEVMKSLTDQVKNISKSLSYDINFGDIDNLFKSTKKSKRDVDSDDVSTLKAELKRKCNIYGLPENYPSVEVAIDNFNNCMKSLANRVETDKTSNGESLTVVGCRYAPEARRCFVEYTDALRPCLPHYRGGYFPFANISNAVVNYLCFDEGAQERTKLFVEEGMHCVYSRLNKVEECFNATYPAGTYPKIEENAYLFSDENCRKLAELRKCAKTELQICSPAVISFLEGLNNVMEQFYTPCPAKQTAQEVNLV